MNSNPLHKPVLLNEVLEAFQRHFLKTTVLHGVDGTFGRGGHSVALLENFESMTILGVDQDVDAVEYAKTNYQTYIGEGRLRLLQANFSDIEKLDKALPTDLDFVFLDIGVSSPQLDNPERGFSFYKDGPLDMRMDQSRGETAADVMNTRSLEELRSIFLDFGEVYASDKLLDAIGDFRENQGFKTTLDLADLIERKCGWRKKGSHPATLYFQALRIYINEELISLEKALSFYTEKLRPGGIFAIISFHSLEDRMIKRFFKNNEAGEPVNKKVIKPSREEELENKRARSAKLRLFKKYEGV